MAEEKKGFFKRLVSGLAKTRDNIVAGFDSIFSGYSSIDEDLSLIHIWQIAAASRSIMIKKQESSLLRQSRSWQRERTRLFLR